MLKAPYHSEIDKNYLYYSKENKYEKLICKISFNKKRKVNLIKSRYNNEIYFNL